MSNRERENIHSDQENIEPVGEIQPILETEKDVSYLGVKLEKAEDSSGALVPKREQYKDFINDIEIALPLQRDLAVSFLSGDPMMVEGGTSLGKTTTIKKMAAELGWEVHYVNLNGTTDVEDLMGKYIPNHNKKSAEDPEYIFADGKVTSGLRQEPGKKKIIVLDEYNAAAPNVLIRLHEVLDALERGGDVVLSEDASESLGTDKESTKVVALTNPPGKGFFGREPLDPAQLRRWVYKKLPGELPDETFSYATDALFGSAVEAQEAPESMYFHPNDEALLQEQLPEIPGMEEILAKYKEFHRAAKALLKNRSIAEDQPQPFTYDDRMEPRRVRDFVLRYYRGDIAQTFQQALEYYYANKLEFQEDTDKLWELIAMVEYQPKEGDSKRKGLESVVAKIKEDGGEEREKQEEDVEILRARDPEKFFTDIVDTLNLPDAWSRWTSDLTEKGYVDMNGSTDRFPVEFLDQVTETMEREADNDERKKTFEGLQPLINELKDKGIISIDVYGQWFLKVVEKEWQEKRVKNVVFKGRRVDRGGGMQYTSSKAGRKFIVLDDYSSIEPEDGKSYTVHVLIDTEPDNPTKGKYIVEIIGETPKPPQTGPRY